MINAFVSEGVVIELPRELSLDESLGGQGLHGLDDFQVGHINFGVLGEVKVLGSNQGTVYKQHESGSIRHWSLLTFEEGFVNGLSVFLLNKHNEKSTKRVGQYNVIYIIHPSLPLDTKLERILARRCPRKERERMSKGWMDGWMDGALTDAVEEDKY
jgi:hypothetical protein